MANRGCTKFEAFASHVEKSKNTIQLEQYDYCQPCAMNSETPLIPTNTPNIVSDDEDSISSEDTASTVAEETPTIEEPIVEDIQQFMDFGDEQQQETVQIQENEDVFASTDSGELLRYHYRFGHMLFARLKQMAKEGLIPKKLRNAKVPTCAACQFGKMTKRNW